MPSSMPTVGGMASPASSTPPCGTSSNMRTNRRRNSRKAHICKTCHKIFSRQEHCVRHERSHTRERPFPCRYCQNRYARKDLVARHEKSLHADIYTAPVHHSEAASRCQGSSDTQKPKQTRFQLQQDLEADPTLEEFMDAQSGAVQFPPSPRSSGAQNDLEFDGLDDFCNGLGLNFNVPLTPMEMEISDLPVDVAYSHSESHHSPSNELPHSNYLVQSHLSNNDELRNQDTHKNEFQGSRGKLPPHTLDPIFDLDLFGIMAHPDTNEFISSTFASEPRGADRDYPSNNIPCHEFEQEKDSPQSRRDDFQPSELLSQGNGPELQGSAYSTYDASSLGTTREQRSHSLIVDDRIRKMLLRDLGRRLGPEQCKTLKLPTSSLLQRFLSSYQTCFHQHYPILHLASMDLEQVPSPLTLSICAIGALYRLERKHAVCLQQWADRALRSITDINPSTNTFSSSATWVVQCKLLLAFARVFSGVPAVVRTTLESLEYFSLEYNFRRIDLEKTLNSVQVLVWSDWLERETSKRLLLGILVLNSLVSITYNTTPRISMLPDAEIELPHEEALWEAPSSNQWLEIMISRNEEPSPRVIDAVNHVLFRKVIGSQDAPLALSTFATTIVMHAVNVHIYHLIQCTQTFTVFNLDNASQSMHAAAVHQAESALERCQNLFTNQHLEQEQTLDDPGGCRRSNGHAILRVAYVRACSGMDSLNRLVLLNTTSEDMARDIHTYICKGQKRTALVTTTARKALDGLFTAVKAGTLLAMKTAAFKWSIDHAIADWSCALFVTRWIHTLECQQHTHPLDFKERQILEDVIELLSDADINYERNTSLAAEVIRLWADFFDDTWVWGITPRIGAVMRAIATVCESSRKACHAPAYCSYISGLQN